MEILHLFLLSGRNLGLPKRTLVPKNIQKPSFRGGKSNVQLWLQDSIGLNQYGEAAGFSEITEGPMLSISRATLSRQRSGDIRSVIQINLLIISGPETMSNI